MALHEIEFNAGKLWELRGHIDRQPFASMDPGKHGAIVTYESPQLTPDGLLPKPLTIYPLAAGLEMVVADLRKRGVQFLVVENQHQKMNNYTALKLAQRAGYVAAMLAGAYMDQRLDVSVLWTHPASWQSILRTLENRRKLESGEAKKLAMRWALKMVGEDGRFRGSTKEQQQGIADSVMQAVWAARTLWMPSAVHSLEAGA